MRWMVLPWLLLSLSTRDMRMRKLRNDSSASIMRSPFLPVPGPAKAPPTTMAAIRGVTVRTFRLFAISHSAYPHHSQGVILFSLYS